MVIVTCSVPDCEFQSEDVSEALAIALLTNHGLAHQNSAPQPKHTALRGPKPKTCAFATKCPCGLSANYTDHAIRDVIVNGLYDNDIRREVLGVVDILQKPVNEVIALVENKEMARNAMPSSSLSAVSSFRRQTNPNSKPLHRPVPYRPGQGDKMP